MKAIELLKCTRAILLKTVDGLTDAQLKTVPAGFNNNILWNLAHADGSIELAYPRGPNGFVTYLARVGPNGKLQSIRNVLDSEHFARILPGMTKEQVLRLLGPSEAAKTTYFKARDELAWDWRYQMASGQPARFIVSFDATAGTVRSTMSLIEDPTPGLPDIAVGR